LSRADDAEYLPDDPGIWPIPGRQPFNATAEASAIKCGGFFQFEPDISKFITLVGGTYRIADAGAGGTFSNLLTGQDSAALRFDQANLGNQHLIFDGVNRNRVISSDLTTTPQGMLANTAAPILGEHTGAGAGFTLGAASTITYWMEEQVRSGTTVVKRNAASLATTVTLTGGSGPYSPRITYPTVVNSDVTHVALYGTEANGEFPIGAQLGSVAVGGVGYIDDLRTATTFPTGEVYPTVAVELNGEAVTTPKYGEPPISSTGDVFEGSVVQNDVDDEAIVRFTFPSDIHAHPATNAINIRTNWKDKVAWVRSLGRACLVGMTNSLYRIDTLPLPEDAGFQTDRIRTEIEGAFGSVSPLAVAKFSFGQGSLLAYVSPHGIIVTDGAEWDVLTADLDWEATVNIGGLSRSILVNNPRRYRLEFYYTPADSGANSRVLYFHYHPSHVKASPGAGLRAKVTGPNHGAAEGAFVANLSDGPSDFFTFTCNADGVLYREGTGSVDEAGSGGIAFVVRTGDLYLNGIGGEATFRRGYLHHNAGLSGQEATIRQVLLAEGEAPLELTELLPVDLREATGAYQEGIADAFQFGVEMTNPVQRVRFDYLTIDYDPAGEEQSP